MIDNSCLETLQGWRKLYRAALAETDGAKAPITHRRGPQSTHLAMPRAIFNLVELRWREGSYRRCHVRAEGVGRLPEAEHKRSETDLEGRLACKDTPAICHHGTRQSIMVLE